MIDVLHRLRKPPTIERVVRRWWMRWFGWAHVHQLQLENAQLHLRVGQLEARVVEAETQLRIVQAHKRDIQSTYMRRHGDNP